MIGYKGFTENLTCKDFQYAENETFEITGPLELYKNGFHFCDIPGNVLNYYNNSTDKYAIIEALDEILLQDDKLVTNKIKIIKVISKEELLNLCGNNVFKVLSGEYHFKDNVLHRINNLPAKIYNNGKQFWYKNGLLHRENDLPAKISNNGDRLWFVNGLCHRENDLPAVIITNGDQRWYKNGLLHRLFNKPAIIHYNGIKLCFKNGKYYDGTFLLQ